MKSQEWELQSGLKFNLEVPETPTEFDGLPGGRVGLCVECANDDVMYRGPFAVVRDLLAEAVAAEYTQVVRATKPHPNSARAKKGETVFAESPGKYLARAAVEVNPQAGDGEEALVFQPLLDKIMATSAELIAKRNEGTKLTDDEEKQVVEFSVEKAARTGSGGLVGKGDLNDAANLIAQGPEKLAISLGKLQAAMNLPEAIVLDATDPELAKRQLGLKLKEYRAQIMKQQVAGLSA